MSKYICGEQLTTHMSVVTSWVPQ